MQKALTVTLCGAIGLLSCASLALGADEHETPETALRVRVRCRSLCRGSDRSSVIIGPRGKRVKRALRRSLGRRLPPWTNRRRSDGRVVAWQHLRSIRALRSRSNELNGLTRGSQGFPCGAESGAEDDLAVDHLHRAVRRLLDAVRGSCWRRTSCTTSSRARRRGHSPRCTRQDSPYLDNVHLELLDSASEASCVTPTHVSA
jgi:hypothetical protein